MNNFDDQRGPNDALIAALTGASQNPSSRRAAQKAKKVQRQTEVYKAIAGAVEAWTGHTVHENGYIPVIRNEEFLGYFGFDDRPLANPIQAVASSIFIPTREETKRVKAITQELSASLDGLRQVLCKLSDDDLIDLGKLTQGDSPQSGEMIDRTLHGIGYLPALARCLDAVGNRISLADKALEEGMTRQKAAKQASSNPTGRFRHEARYSAAAGLAKIYALATGKTPTHSQSGKYLSGAFTPQLRAVFDAAGWPEASLEGPTLAAIDQLTVSDFHTPKHPLPKHFPLLK